MRLLKEIYEAVDIPDISDKSSYTDLMDMMDEASKRFAASRKALGLVNKLKNTEDRRKHRKMVMSNMNKLRGLVQRIYKQMDRVMEDES